LKQSFQAVILNKLATFAVLYGWLALRFEVLFCQNQLILTGNTQAVYMACMFDQDLLLAVKK